MAGIVKDISKNFEGTAKLVEHKGVFYVVNSTHITRRGYKTVAFKSDEHGNIDGQKEIKGIKGLSIEDVVKELDRL